MATNKSNRTVYIDDDLWAKFSAIAEQRDRAANNMLVLVIRDFVKSQGSADGQVQEQGSVRTS